MKKISLEEIFLLALGSDEKLKWFLKGNINLVHYIDAKFRKYMALTDMTLALIPREKVRELVKDINRDKIIKFLYKERLDLWKTLTTDPKGILWLDTQIDNFRKRFL